jgi:hypothetical protein
VTSGRALTAALAVVSALLVSTTAAAEPPPGLLDGEPHIVRLRPQLDDVPAPPRRVTRREAAAAAAAVATCDPAQVDALDRVPTTERADDAAACVVLEPTTGKGRLLLSPSRVSGDGIGAVQRRRVGKDRYDVRLQLTRRGADLTQLTPPELAGIPQVLDLDGVVVGAATIEDAGDDDLATIVVTPRSGEGFTRDAADDLVARLRQARGEQLVELSRAAGLTREARELVADNATRIDDKDAFKRACPNAEDAATLILGCYTGDRIDVLRVDQANLAGVMTVSLAHEILHAAFDELPAWKRSKVVDQLEAFMRKAGDADIEQLLAEYEDTEPGQRATELHSLVGTQVASLPRALERHYAQYFDDRSRVVDAFVGYQAIFDDLQARYDALLVQAKSLESQIADADGAFQIAGATADRLYEEIQSLRAQGRLDESNALVDRQNAAADEANALADQYNGLIDQYNATVAELNTLAAALNETYNAISPEPIELPTE